MTHISPVEIEIRPGQLGDQDDPQFHEFIPKLLDVPAAERFFKVLHPAGVHFYQITAV